MPRPVKDDPRDHFKTFRFSEAEITRLEDKARRSGKSVSAYVRTVLLEEPQTAPEAPSTQRRRRMADPALLTVAEQMRRVGVNLNQIAHRMNEQRMPPPRELVGVLGEIRTLVRQVREP